MPPKRSKQSNKKKSKGRGASNHTSSSTAEAVPSSTPPEDDDVLAWIESGGDTPAQVVCNEEARSRASANDADDSSTRSTATLIHKDDNIEQVVQWIEKDGRITGARLAKRLPYTAQTIRDGEVSHEGVAKELADRVIAHSNVAEEQHGALRHLWTSNDNRDRDGLLQNVTFMLVSLILPIGREGSVVFVEVLTDMHSKLRRAVLQAAENDDSWKAMERAAFTRVVKCVFEETCTEWAEQLDAKLYPGRPAGTFRQECSLIDAPLEAFNTFLVENFYAHDVIGTTQEGIYARLVWDATRMDDSIVKKRLARDLRHATEAISKGVDEGSKVCWECGATLATANECTGCKAALYCDDKCQLKAWKEGHKRACSNLKVKHEHYLESLQAVDDTHRSGVLGGKPLSSFAFDYNELRLVHTLPSLPGTNSLGERSMKYFYENLARVVRGDWWLFGESEALSAEEFKRLVRVNRGTETKERIRMNFNMLSMYLAYDYVGFAVRVGTEEAAWLLAEMFRNLHITSAIEFGAAMPADVYLEMHRQNKPAKSKAEKIKLRRYSKLANLKYLRDNFHKAS